LIGFIGNSIPQNEAKAENTAPKASTSSGSQQLSAAAITAPQQQETASLLVYQSHFGAIPDQWCSLKDTMSCKPVAAAPAAAAAATQEHHSII